MLDFFNFSETTNRTKTLVHTLVYQSMLVSSVIFLCVLGLALSFPSILPASFYISIAQHPYMVIGSVFLLSGISFYGKTSLLDPRSNVMQSLGLLSIYWILIAVIFSLPLSMYETTNIAIAAAGAIGSLLTFSLYGITMSLATQKKVSGILTPLLFINIIFGIGLCFFYQNFAYIMLFTLCGLIWNFIALMYTSSMIKNVIEDPNNQIFFSEKTNTTRLMLFLSFTMMEQLFSIFLHLLRILELLNNDKKRER